MHVLSDSNQLHRIMCQHSDDPQPLLVITHEQHLLYKIVGERVGHKVCNVVDDSFKDHIHMMLPFIKLLLQIPAPILVLGHEVDVFLDPNHVLIPHSPRISKLQCPVIGKLLESPLPPTFREVRVLVPIKHQTVFTSECLELISTSSKQFICHGDTTCIL